MHNQQPVHGTLGCTKWENKYRRDDAPECGEGSISATPLV
jgi:hypothetical protein